VSVFTSRLLATDLNTEISTSTYYEVFLLFRLQSLWNLRTKNSSGLTPPAYDWTVVALELILSLTRLVKVEVKVKATLRLTVSQSVSKSWCRAPCEAHDQIFIAVLTVTVLFFVGRPLWQEDGSVFCICCWSLPAQSFSGPSPLVFATIFYYLRFEASFFVVSYDSQGHDGGIRPCLHTALSSPERILSLPYVDAERTWTYSKHISCDRYPASLLAHRSDLQKTRHMVFSHCCVTSRRTRKTQLPLLLHVGPCLKLLPGNALIKSVIIRIYKANEGVWSKGIGMIHKRDESEYICHWQQDRKVVLLVAVHAASKCVFWGFAHLVYFGVHLMHIQIHW
jgi:hypothetical protein